LRGVLWLAGDGTSGRSGQSAKIFQIPEVPLKAQFATATITRAVTVAAGVYAPGHLGGLTQYLPSGLVDDVLEQTRTVQRRLRALPSRAGVYFLLALAMFPRLGYLRVWGKLTAGLDGLEVPPPSGKALRDLRRRLGPAPVKALFDVVAGPLGQPRTPGVCFAGLRTVAFDGLNSLKVPGTDRNRSWIGQIRFRMGFAGYPTLRLMALAETGTRGLLGAVLGSAGGRDEAYLARRLLHLLRPGMLLLLDRAFDPDTFLAEVHATGAMLLARARPARNPRVVRHLPDGSCLSDLDGLAVRIIEADVTITGMAQPHPRLARKPQPQVAADLLRAPPLSQQLSDQLAQLAVALDPPPVRAGTARGRAAVGLERTVTAAPDCVAAQLTRDRRRRPS
jgi:Insertion element 4 transposase N-terminal